MVGTFAIGRRYPVFREFLLYAAQLQRPSYGAAVKALQGVGQIAVMAVIFVLVMMLFGERLARWMTTRLHQPQVISSCALAAGGAYFLFYWGIARVWPELGRWGFKLGWHS